MAMLAACVATDSRPRWIAILRAFIDESGTDGRSPVLVVAAYAAPTEPDDYWTPFRSAWVDRVLSGDDRAVLHTKEAVENLNREPEWGDRLSAAAEIINTYTKLRIASVIDRAAHARFAENWRQRMPRGFPPETAYALGVTTCLTEMAGAAQEGGYDDWITYIIEQGHPNFGQVRVILDDILVQPEARKALQLGNYVVAGKGDYIELQASDFFAYWLREYAEAVDFRRVGGNHLHPLCRDLLAGTQYAYWGDERLASYLDEQEHAEREMRREWWRNKMQSDRKRRGQK
jgi:hypothetical protein